MEAKVKKPHGRPSKYDQKFDEMLITHMTEGLSFEAFAGIIEVNVDTLHEWVKVHKSFSDAKKIAFAKCRVFWEKMGISGAWNDAKGPCLNTGVWIFNMKNRFKWSDRMEVSGTGDGEEKPIVLSYKL
jgi:hypothetical protein